MGESGKDELYRRLEQARRLASVVTDGVTVDRISRLVADLESQLAEIEARDADAPPE